MVVHCVHCGVNATDKKLTGPMGAVCFDCFRVRYLPKRRRHWADGATTDEGQHETFEEWLSRLNGAAVDVGVAQAGGKPLAEQTGTDCWREHFENGLSPLQALAEDASYG